VIDPEAAVIVVLPAESPDASPAALMVPTLLLLDDQVTVAVMFRVLPSEKTPVAVYWDVPPITMEVFVGESVIVVKVAELTVATVCAEPR
jgi:hypothetical protein